jgi:uncharacterized protein
MSKDYGKQPRTDIRFKPRIVEDDIWIKTLLHRAEYGVVATIYEGQPFAMNNLFVYDEAAHAIYMHTAQVGRLRANVETDERICFTVAEIGRLLPHRQPVEFDVEYKSVVIFGRGHLIEDQEAKRQALQLLLDKYAPHLKVGVDYDEMPEYDLKRTCVYCINIDEWTGKQNEAPPDFPGAFTYLKD